jgi:hypothetical protein
MARDALPGAGRPGSPFDVVAYEPVRLILTIALDGEGRPVGMIGEGEVAVLFCGWLDLMAQVGRLARAPGDA